MILMSLTPSSGVESGRAFSLNGFDEIGHCRQPSLVWIAARHDLMVYRPAMLMHEKLAAIDSRVVKAVPLEQPPRPAAGPGSLCA